MDLNEAWNMIASYLDDSIILYIIEYLKFLNWTQEMNTTFSFP